MEDRIPVRSSGISRRSRNSQSQSFSSPGSIRYSATGQPTRNSQSQSLSLPSESLRNSITGQETRDSFALHDDAPRVSITEQQTRNSLSQSFRSPGSIRYSSTGLQTRNSSPGSIRYSTTGLQTRESSPGSIRYSTTGQQTRNSLAQSLALPSESPRSSIIVQEARNSLNQSFTPKERQTCASKGFGCTSIQCTTEEQDGIGMSQSLSFPSGSPRVSITGQQTRNSQSQSFTTPRSTRYSSTGQLTRNSQSQSFSLPSGTPRSSITGQDTRRSLNQSLSLPPAPPHISTTGQQTGTSLSQSFAIPPGSFLVSTAQQQTEPGLSQSFALPSSSPQVIITCTSDSKDQTPSTDRGCSGASKAGEKKAMNKMKERINQLEARLARVEGRDESPPLQMCGQSPSVVVAPSSCNSCVSLAPPCPGPSLQSPFLGMAQPVASGFTPMLAMPPSITTSSVLLPAAACAPAPAASCVFNGFQTPIAVANEATCSEQCRSATVVSACTLGRKDTGRSCCQAEDSMSTCSDSDEFLEKQKKRKSRRKRTSSRKAAAKEKKEAPASGLAFVACTPPCQSDAVFREPHVPSPYGRIRPPPPITACVPVVLTETRPSASKAAEGSAKKGKTKTETKQSKTRKRK